MPVLKYYDPTTGTWKMLTSGIGTGSDAVIAQAEEPAEPTEGMIWVDTDETTVTRPAPVLTFAGAKVYTATAVPVANAIMVPVTFDATQFDADNLHDPVVNNDRVLLNRVGFWRVTTTLGYAANTNGERRARIYYNGALWSQANIPAPAGEAFVSHSDVIEATATTDYVSVYAYQTSGVALNVLATPQTFLAVEYLGVA